MTTMRAAAFLALALASMALAGCSSDEETDHPCGAGHVDEHCPSPSPTSSGTTPPPTTSAPPNKPPVISLKVLANGTVGNVTTVGGSLTFDASGSSDADGEIVDAAITLIMANQTAGGVAPRSLMSNGAFVPVTYTLGAAGPARVSVAVVDSEGDIVILDTFAYVNEVKDAGTFGFKAKAAEGSDPTKCKGTLEQTVPAGQGTGPAVAADEAYFHRYNFIVPAGASFIEAKVQAGASLIAICSAEALALSPAGSTNVTTSAGTEVAAGTDYYVAVFSNANPTPPATAQDVAIQVTIHFEPRK